MDGFNGAITHSRTRIDRVATFRRRRVRFGDGVLEYAPVLFNGLDRPDAVVIACHEDAIKAKPFAGDEKSVSQDFRGVASPSKVWNHGIPDMSAYALEKRAESVPNRDAADDVRS